MSFHYRYRKQIMIITLVGILFIGLLSFGVYSYFHNSKKEKKTGDIILEKKGDNDKSNSLEKEIAEVMLEVDIKGEVNYPGIYSLKESSRVIDVINMAGGLTENANTTVINLSKKIKDEMVIIIYSNQEVEDFKKTKEIEKQVISNCIQKDENSLLNDACIDFGDAKEENSIININTATKEEIMLLPGLGEAKAQSIIDYRNSNGPFTTIEDLLKVTGIGENLFAQIKEYITT